LSIKKSSSFLINTWYVLIKKAGTLVIFARDINKVRLGTMLLRLRLQTCSSTAAESVYYTFRHRCSYSYKNPSPEEKAVPKYQSPNNVFT